MDSVRIVIGGLGAACLLVASLIVVVLRRPAPGGRRRQRVDEVEAQTLARIYAVRPAPATPSQEALDELAALAYPPASEDAAPLGRIMDLPDLLATPGMSGVPAPSQYMDERDRALPAARIPAGPLPFERVSAQAGWGDGADTPIARLGSGELPLSTAPNGTPAFGVWPANSPGNLAGTQSAINSGNLGRMPGFAPAPSSPPSPPSPPIPPAAPERMADATEQRRLGALTRVYVEGIEVAYDPVPDAVEVAFSACPMRTRAEVALAFRVLLAKVRTVLKPLGRDRAALLLDVGGLEIGPDMTPVWTGGLREFLVTACEQARTRRLLAVRYNSRAPSAGNRQEMLTRIHSATPDVLQGLQNTIFGSREEAAALLARLRAGAPVPGA